MRHSVSAVRVKGEGEVNARLAGSLLSSTSLSALLIAGLALFLGASATVVTVGGAVVIVVAFTVSLLADTRRSSGDG